MVSQVKEEVVYALGHTDEERQRLIDQDELFRPTTEGLFRTAGIERGMRVLDAGCGVGDVSMLAASFVGPEGTVIGVDKDARSLALARQRAEEARESTRSSAMSGPVSGNSRVPWPMTTG